MDDKSGHEIVKKVSVRARKALDPLWERALTTARSWGKKRNGRNPFFRTNIMFSDGKNGGEVVIITFDDDGIATVHEYRRTYGTSLGRRARKLLERAGIPIHK